MVFPSREQKNILDAHHPCVNRLISKRIKGLGLVCTALEDMVEDNRRGRDQKSHVIHRGNGFF